MQNICVISWVLFGLSVVCNLVLAVFVILLCRIHGCHVYRRTAENKGDSHTDTDIALQGTTVMQSVPKTETEMEYEPMGDMVSF